MPEEIQNVFSRLLPRALDSLLAGALGDRLPRHGADDRYVITATGRFAGRLIGDMLVQVRNQRTSGALLLVEPDVVRTLYVRRGRVVGADSDVLFDRLGRVMGRAGELSPSRTDALVEIEERDGLAAAAHCLTDRDARRGLERRVREIASAVFLMSHAHYVLVAGDPQLADLPALDLSPSELAVEGLRRYDEWRNRSAG